MNIEVQERKVILIPNLKVGDFELGQSIQFYIENFKFQVEIADEYEIPKWDIYSLEAEGLELYVEDNIIVSIACRKDLILNNLQLIGGSVSAVMNKLNLEYDDKDAIYLNEEDEAHDVYEFTPLGLQVWEKNNVIDCVFCYKNDD